MLQSAQKVEEGSIVDWLQHILNHSELVEGSSQVEGPDENLVHTYW